MLSRQGTWAHRPLPSHNGALAQFSLTPSCLQWAAASYNNTTPESKQLKSNIGLLLHLTRYLKSGSSSVQQLIVRDPVFPSLCSTSSSTLDFIFTFPGGWKAAAEMSGVTALCGLSEDRHLLLSYQQPNLSHSSQQTSLNLTGRSWSTCPPPQPTNAQGMGPDNCRAPHP